MITKKLLSLILTTSVIVTSFSSVTQISAQTEEASNQTAQVIVIEDENVQTASRPAEPTKEFIISSENDFESFMTTSEYWGSNYKVKLACDIDMKMKAFKPIKEFYGIFDGCGHTISNLKIQNKSDKSKNTELSFINILNVNAEIKNVTFDKYTIEGKSDIKKAAGLILTNNGIISGIDVINGNINNIDKKANAAGYVLDNKEDGVIENCHIENMSVKDAMIKSGFVGTNLGKITGCSTTLLVISEDIAGGFCGINDGEISNCKSEGIVTINAKSKDSTLLSGKILTICGGFVGINSDNGKINSCKTTCNVKSNAKVAIILCGGFVGLNSGKIDDCIVKGEVYGYSSYNAAKGFGIIIGINIAISAVTLIASIISSFYPYLILVTFILNIGTLATGISLYSLEGVKIKDNYINLGGFCGNNIGEISSSRFEGSATANAKTVKTKCGGFVGNNDKKGKINKCTSTGSATGEEYVGGFAGVNNAKISGCNAYGKATAKTKTNTTRAGGFVGENEKGIIISCTATGGADVRSSSGKAKAGGFVGINKASIINSKASGDVYLSAGTCYKDDGCGGFVGKNDQGGNIEGCYAESLVETTNKKKGGGFVGEAKSKSTIKNSQCKTKIVTKSGTKNNIIFCQNKDKKAVIQN